MWEVCWVECPAIVSRMRIGEAWLGDTNIGGVLGGHGHQALDTVREQRFEMAIDWSAWAKRGHL